MFSIMVRLFDNKLDRGEVRQAKFAVFVAEGMQEADQKPLETELSIANQCHFEKNCCSECILSNIDRICSSY